MSAKKSICYDMISSLEDPDDSGLPDDIESGAEEVRQQKERAVRTQTHVFTSTYAADVSGVCSAMYELGGMTVLHDPSGCNSTYTTHDEPRWYDSDSLMFISGLDEMQAVMGDDSQLLDDVEAAARDLKPRFITLCGSSIPHIMAFDYVGTAHLMEQRCGIPVLPVATDGLKSYVSGVGLALTEWIRRFARRKTAAGEDAASRGTAGPSADKEAAGRDTAGSSADEGGAAGSLQAEHGGQVSVNLLGVTPLDFSVNGNVAALRQAFEDAGIRVNGCFAMGDSFDRLTCAFEADVNVVVSSAGRQPAKYMRRVAQIPSVEGLPIGREQTEAVMRAVRMSAVDRRNRKAYEDCSIPAEEAGTPQAEQTFGNRQDALDRWAADRAEKEAGTPQAEQAFGRRQDALDRWAADRTREEAGTPQAEQTFGAIQNVQDSGAADGAGRQGVFLVIGEEVFAQSLCAQINALDPGVRGGRTARCMFPDVDEGLSEDDLIAVCRQADLVIADPLYRMACPKEKPFIGIPHEAYSGRIFRDEIPVFCGPEFDISARIRAAWG